MAYEIKWTKGCVEWHYTGVVTGRDIIRSNNDIYGDARFDDLYSQIVDLSSVEKFEVSEIEMKQMAHLDKAAAKSNAHIKVAVIAPNEPAQKIAEAYAKFCPNSPWENAIFQTRDEAIAWLTRQT